MQRTTADIERIYDRNPLTGSTFTSGYKWIGPLHGAVRLDALEWDRLSDFFPGLPWQLEKIDESYYDCSVVAVRTDVPFPLYAYQRFEADALAIARHLQTFGARLVLTAQVWGFAYVPRGVFPSWQHLGRFPR